MNKLMFASVISEIQQSDVFMTVRARICETPAANLNGARVTEAFIDEIVGNEKRYVGLPLYADVKALVSGKYNRLGHLYDSDTGEFHSTQIGSFYKFEKEEFEHDTIDGVRKGSYLIGYARIPKRNKKLSKAISELFADGALKFSFEITVGEYEELDDNTILIDASENNYLEGTAIVTFPACEEAVALELVAQKADDAEGGEMEMADVQKPAEELAEQAEAEATEIASTETEKVEEVAQQETAEQPEEAETQAETQTETAETETAGVAVTQYHEESTSTSAYDTETGKEVSQTVRVETVTRDYVEGTLVESTDGIHVAETVIAEPDTPTDASTDTPAEETPTETSTETPAEDTPTEDGAGDGQETGGETPAETPTEEPVEEEVPVTDAVENKKTAELIAELMATIQEMKKEIAELKEKKVETAQVMTAEINPFTSNLNAEPTYSLLSKGDFRSNNDYSLLQKA